MSGRAGPPSPSFVHVGPWCVKVECPAAGPVYLDPSQPATLEQPLPAAAVPTARRAVMLGLRPDRSAVVDLAAGLIAPDSPVDKVKELTSGCSLPKGPLA